MGGGLYSSDERHTDPDAVLVQFDPDLPLSVEIGTDLARMLRILRADSLARSAGLTRHGLRSSIRLRFYAAHGAGP